MKDTIQSLQLGESEIFEITMEEATNLINEFNGEFGVTNAEHGYCTITRFKKRSDSIRINKICKDAPYFKEVLIEGVSITYLRTIVSRFNKENAMEVKVHKKEDGIYLFKGFNKNADEYEQLSMQNDLKAAFESVEPDDEPLI